MLLEGSGANSGQYLVWSTDVNGQIIDGSGADISLNFVPDASGCNIDNSGPKINYNLGWLLKIFHVTCTRHAPTEQSAVKKADDGSDQMLAVIRCRHRQ